MGLALLLAVSGPAAAQIRTPAVAGAFYPGEAAELERTVDQLLASAPPAATGTEPARVVGLISPHAGYQFSGPTAAVAFKSLSGQAFDRVYFLGVDHRSTLPTVSVWPEGAYDTPLGPVPIDATATRELRMAVPEIVAEPRQHTEEHSLEVLLPFYIKVFGMRPAVFVSVGGRPENGLMLGKQLSRLVAGFPGRVLIVASSDWSHFHDVAGARVLDDRGIGTCLALDPEKLLRECEAGTTELCGLNGVLALLTVMKEGGARATLLKRDDSSTASGDSQRVVGYAALLFEAAGAPEPPSQPSPAPREGERQDVATDGPSLRERRQGGSAPPGSSVGMASETRSMKPVEPEGKMKMHEEALAAVRTTLEKVLAGGKIPTIAFQDPRFREECGIFVTLKKQGELRGCIGFIQGVRPLGEAIQEMAVSAATRDPRFPPVTLDELKEIDIEISVLSPMIPVKGLEEIKVGRDGLLLKRGYRSGLLLPQVATEWGWDRDTFLEHLCQKAGLPSGSHREPDAELFRFTAEVFGEKEP